MPISQINTNSIASSSVGTAQLASSPTITTPTIAQINSAASLTPTAFYDNAGVQVGTLCRAWVNYKGTSTRSIRASFNVSSVTYNSSGNYTINFTNAMSDSNYCITGFGKNQYTNGIGTIITGDTNAVQTTSACQVYAVYTNGSGIFEDDASTVCIAIFR